MISLRTRIPLLFALLLIPMTASADYWVFGGVCSSCWNASPVNQLLDDGLHGDGAAGDGVFGVDIAADVPAGVIAWLVAPTSFFPLGPSWPYCWCSSPPSYAVAWTTGSGELIHYAFDTRSNGWYPGPGLASDHGLPAPAPLEVCVASHGQYDRPMIVVSATHAGPIWEAVVLLPAAAPYDYWFRTSTNSVRFTGSYNSSCPCAPFEQPVASITTGAPNTYVRFQFDESVGRMRAEVADPTSTQRPSWGEIKAAYR